MSSMWPSNNEAAALDYLDLDLAELKARIEEDEGDHALSLVLLDDRDRVAQLVAENDRLDEAIAALDRVAEVVSRLGGLLRVRRGDLAVLDVLADPPPPAAPPMNAGAPVRRTLAEG